MDIKMVRLISQWHSTFKSQNPLQRILRLHKACQSFCTSSKLTLRHAGGDSDESNSDRIPEAGRYRSPWTILKEEFKVNSYKLILFLIHMIARNVIALLINVEW